MLLKCLYFSLITALILLHECHATGAKYMLLNEASSPKKNVRLLDTDAWGVRTEYYEQPVDHFSFVNADKFEQRYIVCDKHWKKPGGPIFFYTGNEGDIVWFMNNTGLMFDWAPKFGAMLIFAEHRYYGQSLPYGKDSYKDLSHLGYLTSEQALADYVSLISHIKSSVPGASGSPVVAMGGSYGGMLAAWIRIKYPHSVIGALAASAPVWNFEDLTPCNGFMSVVTQDFIQAGKNCAANIRKSWNVILKTAESAEGRAMLTSRFQLCETLRSGSELVEWLTTAWVYMSMVDYPFPAEFLSPLPAWPVKVSCSHLNESNPSDTNLLKSIRDAANVFYNYTGAVKCFKLNDTGSPDLGVQGWNFQACSEMIMPMCSDGVQDMFLPSSWNLTAYTESCKKQYGVESRPRWIVEEYGGKNILAASNIIFSNGRLDPWSAGGVLKSLSSSLIAIIIDDGAHHLDLRAPTDLDPPSVVQARRTEKQIIEGWIQQHTYQSLRLTHSSLDYSTKADCHRNFLSKNCSSSNEKQRDTYDIHHSMSITARLLICSILTLIFLVLVFFIGFTAHGKTTIVTNLQDSRYSSIDKITSL